MSENAKTGSRRDLLRRAAGMTAVAAAAVAGAAGSAEAAGMSKASVNYQSKPKDGHQCDGCSLFIPGPTKTAMGKCKVVAGPISPKGWCELWSPKSS